MNTGLIYILGLQKEIKANSGMILSHSWEGFFVFMPVKLNYKFEELCKCEKRCHKKKGKLNTWMAVQITNSMEKD